MKTLLFIWFGLVTADLPALAAAQLGEKIWNLQTGGGNSSPALGADDYKVRGLDGVTALEKWEFLAENSMSSSPALESNATVRGDARNTGLADPLLVVIPPVHFIARRVTVSHRAGSGDAGYADGTGANAQFDSVADNGNHSVREIVIVEPVAMTPDAVQRQLPAGYAVGSAVLVTLDA